MLFALVLTGCYLEADSTCEHTVREVADDDPIGELGTVAELLAPLTRTHTFVGTLSDDTPTDASLALARAAGPATFRDGEWVEGEAVLKPGFDEDTLMYVSCDDTLELPLSVDLATANGEVTAAGTATFAAGDRTATGLVGTVRDGVVSAEEPSAGDVGLGAYFGGGELTYLSLAERADAGAVFLFYERD